MNQEILTEALLRQFLLGKVDEHERERVENLFLTDPQVHERVLAAEQDLIEDYLDGSLDAADKELFLERYGQTSAQQRQLQINREIKNWARRESASTNTVSEKISVWTRLRERLRLKPALLIPIVVTAMIVVVIVASWLSSRRKQQTIEQELAVLNTPASLRAVPPNLSTLDLSPVAVRSAEKEAELKKISPDQLFELRLPWPPDERYHSYQAEVSRVEGEERFRIANLQREGDRVPIIRLRLPARVLRRGHYKISVRGVNTDGSHGLPKDYTFAISE